MEHDTTVIDNNKFNFENHVAAQAIDEGDGMIRRNSRDDLPKVGTRKSLNSIFLHLMEDGNILNNNDQTTHISSINNYINKAILIIIEESKKYSPVEKPLHKLFKCPFLVGEPYYYNWFLNIINPFFNQFKDITLKMALLEWMKYNSVHTVHNITFSHLITMIMTIVENHKLKELTIVENHKRKELMKERLITELRESVEFCFTRRINCMVIALVGFVDGIYIGLSVREEIEMKISILIKKLNEQKINRETAKEQMIELFSNVGEKDNISDGYKEANLRALDDYDNDFEGFDRL